MAVKYLPAPQSIQVDSATAPSVSEYLPAAQSVHASLPTVGLYFPAAHEAHDCASGPVKPAAQPSCTQSARASLPAGELLPAPQAQQPLSSEQPSPDTDKLPTASLKVATGHSWQEPASRRKPALQRHEPAPAAVAGCELAGQATHAAASVAPATAEYVPAPQSRHVEANDAPVAAEYLPAAQSRHSAAIVAVEYLPAGQLVQTVAAEMEVNLPAVQSEQIDAPAAENLPATQFPQTVLEVPPLLSVNLPATQLSHTVRARS